MKLRCMIVDDEPRAHTVLRHYLDKLPWVTLVAGAANVMEAYEHMKREQIDLVLLDIGMPEMDGFSLIDIAERKPMVIFVTADTQHAFKSYEYGAIDYLHKPIRFERLVKALDKAVKWHQLNRVPACDIELKIDGYNQQLPVADICYIESLGNYCRLVMGRHKIVTLATLKDLEARLPRSSFLRIHKSYIVNLAAISRVTETHILAAGAELPIGKTYKKYIAEHVTGISGQ